jgi:hypothetical protein
VTRATDRVLRRRIEQHHLATRTTGSCAWRRTESPITAEAVQIPIGIPVQVQPTRNPDGVFLGEPDSRRTLIAFAAFLPPNDPEDGATTARRGISPLNFNTTVVTHRRRIVAPNQLLPVIERAGDSVA